MTKLDGMMNPISKLKDIPDSAAVVFPPLMAVKGAAHLLKDTPMMNPTLGGMMNQALGSMAGHVRNITENPEQFVNDAMGGGAIAGSFGGKQALQNLIAAGLRDPKIMEKFKLAEKYLESGRTPPKEMMDDFWKNYQIDLGFADLKPRIEISPHATEYSRSSGRIRNPEFYQAYPGALDDLDVIVDDTTLGVYRSPGDNTGGKHQIGLNLNRTIDEIDSTAEHELTHFADELEGHAAGGNTSMVKGAIPEVWGTALRGRKRKKEVEAKIKTAFAMIPDNTRLPYELRHHARAAFEDYYRDPSYMLGEIMQPDGGKSFRSYLTNRIYDEKPTMRVEEAETAADEIISTVREAVKDQYPDLLRYLKPVAKQKKAERLFEMRAHTAYEDMAGESGARLSQFRKEGMHPDDLKHVRPSQVFDMGVHTDVKGRPFRFAPRDEQIVLGKDDVTIPPEIATARVLRGRKKP